jgi:DNA polymerase III subunit epsilon
MSTTMDANAAALALEQHPDYRVLRRIRTPEVYLDAPVGPVREGVIIDVETTGLEHADHKVIELAIVRFAYDSLGRVVRVIDSYNGLEDPGEPITPEITRITGITDEMVAGQRIDRARANALLDGAALVIAHNARFDRPFVEKVLPVTVDMPWACSVAEIPWRDNGYGSAALEFIALKSGHFYDAHRAQDDCLALLHILATTTLGEEGSFAHLLKSARAKTVRIEAFRSPFETKDLLKARGYRWNAEKKVWGTEIPDAHLSDEVAWLREHIYAGQSVTPPSVELDAYKRYSTRY